MKMNIGKTIGNISKTIERYMPEILTATGIAGMVGTVVLTIKGTTKASKIIEEKKPETKTEVVKEVWTCYVPTVAAFAASTACIVGANKIHLGREATLLAAYSLSSKNLKEYKEKAKELLGEKKEHEIGDAVRSARAMAASGEVPENVPQGNQTTLCYDGVFGRKFYGNIETIRRAAAEINTMVFMESGASVNDFWDKLGLMPTNGGGNLGWNEDHELHLYFSSILDENNQPMLCFDYEYVPRYNWVG